MKAKKLSFLKRIFVLFCCTVLLSSSAFTSYKMTVYASEAEWDDAARAGIWIAATIAGLFFVPEITAPVVIGALAEVGVNSVTIGKYIYENSDGTYTISEDFVQAVMDVAQQLEEQGFTDTDITRQGNGIFYTYKTAITQTYMYNHPYMSSPQSCRDVFNYSAETDARVAGLKETITSTGSDGRTHVSYYWNVYRNDRNYTKLLLSLRGKSVSYADGEVTYSSNNSSSSGFGSLTLDDGTQKSDRYNGSQSFSGNFPIFSSVEACDTYLKTGKGYKDAENYRSQPIFRRHSAYTPTYSGGSVTVNRTVIENITQKITDVDADESLTDDQKIEKLQEYIRTGGNTDIGGGGGGSGNTDYDDNKDLPAGTDITDTNSWLKKIYLKVSQIYDKLNTAVGDAEHAAFTKIQESLDEIIVQLKKIKHWTIADTVIDAADAVADWADLILGVLKDAKEGAGSAVAAIATTVGDSVDMMSQKFPFSVPWDILLFVSLLSAEPQMPYFEIPFNIELSALDIQIDYTMKLDFSQLQWLSDLSRLLLSMTYAVGLLKMTAGITSVGKEG